MSSIVSMIPLLLPDTALFVIAWTMPGRLPLVRLAVIAGLPLGWLVSAGFRANQDELASVAKTVDSNLHILPDSIFSRERRE